MIKDIKIAKAIDIVDTYYIQPSNGGYSFYDMWINATSFQIKIKANSEEEALDIFDSRKYILVVDPIYTRA